MINIDIEKLLLIKLNEELVIETNEKVYIFSKKHIGNSNYLVFNEKEKQENLKLKLDRIEKIIDCMFYKIDDVIDDVEYFMNDIYNTYNVEFVL